MSLIPFAVLLAMMAPLGTLADDPSAPTGRWFPHVLVASLLSLALTYGWVKLNLHLRRARLWGPRHRLTWFVLGSAQLMVAFALLLFSVSYFADRLWWQTLALAMGCGVVGWGAHLYGAMVWRTRLSKLSLAGAAVLLMVFMTADPMLNFLVFPCATATMVFWRLVQACRRPIWLPTGPG